MLDPRASAVLNSFDNRGYLLRFMLLGAALPGAKRTRLFPTVLPNLMACYLESTCSMPSLFLVRRFGSKRDVCGFQGDVLFGCKTRSCGLDAVFGIEGNVPADQDRGKHGVLLAVIGKGRLSGAEKALGFVLLSVNVMLLFMPGGKLDVFSLERDVPGFAHQAAGTHTELISGSKGDVPLPARDVRHPCR